MRPIPLVLLQHSATLYTVSGTDENNVPIISASAPLTAIRCEPIKDTANKSLGEMKDDKLKMFYDCVNSSPLDVVFNIGDNIVHKNNTYFIRTISDYAPHHYELFLK